MIRIPKYGFRLDYVGNQTGEPVLKNSLQVSDLIVRQSGILDSLVEDKTYIFQFATNIPCPGTPTVEYEGQTYHAAFFRDLCFYYPDFYRFEYHKENGFSVRCLRD